VPAAPLPVARTARARPTRVAPAVASAPARQHAPAAVAAQAPPAPAPRAAPQQDDAAAQRLKLTQFAGSIQAAVQAAASMPAAARRQHREGRAQVRFSYLDGAVAEVTLARSSESRVLDDAALAAVIRARYPAPPPPLRGHKIPMAVWVEFHLAQASADG
jgi:protein TonB